MLREGCTLAIMVSSFLQPQPVFLRWSSCALELGGHHFNSSESASSLVSSHQSWISLSEEGSARDRLLLPILFESYWFRPILSVWKLVASATVWASGRSVLPHVCYSLVWRSSLPFSFINVLYDNKGFGPVWGTTLTPCCLALVVLGFPL